MKYCYFCFFGDLDLLTFSSNWNFVELERAPKSYESSGVLPHASPMRKLAPAHALQARIHFLSPPRGKTQAGRTPQWKGKGR